MAIITNISQIAKTKSVKIFKCFSQRLSHEIQNRLGVCPVDVYTHENGKVVNVYIMTPELSALLTEWTANKPKKEGTK